MTNILKLNSIADVVKVNLTEDKYTISDNCTDPVGILVRSADMLSYDFPESVLAVARAGAGVNNIPLDVCASKGIVAFNTPGANANAVKELVLGAMIMASRNVCEAYDWAKTLKGNGDAVAKMAEKGKGQFVGPEISGKTLGVIGLGAIGKLVAQSAMALGMNVWGYDPFATVDGVKKVDSMEEIFAACDIITLHVPQMESTKGMINKDSIALMKDGVIILNFARGGLIKDADVIAACESGKIRKYATDFSSDALIGAKNVICLPHLGASTPESEDNCAFMASKELKEYIELGNINNSVNYPNVSLEKQGAARIAVCYKNTDAALNGITEAVQKLGKVVASVSKTKGDFGYAIFDMDAEVNADSVSAVADVIRVRMI